jgi:phosphatidylserine decarboxylase
VKTTPKAGDSIERGKRIGRILLGSRVDVFMPKGFKSKVKVGDQVKAGVTVLGEL